MLFTLKFFDTELITFELSGQPQTTAVCQIISINTSQKHLLPPGMTPDNEGLAAWLRDRTIPQDRQFEEEIFAACGLDFGDTPGMLRLGKGLSLNDCYWITDADFKGTFAKCNLFENPFHKELSLIAFSGYGRLPRKEFIPSPEFTTGGTLPKGWRKLQGRIKLYKGATGGADNTGNEPYSEVFASQIAEAMALKHVPCSLGSWEGKLCSVCPSFTDLKTSFVPMKRLCKEESPEKIAAFLQDLGKTYFDSFCDMMIFDALICNTDRHPGNFGVMVDNQSNQICGFAPLFDHGLSLFNFAMPEEFDDLDSCAKESCSSSGVSFEDLVSEFITSRQKKQLDRMQHFKFKCRSRNNVQAEKSAALERFLCKRARFLRMF